MKRWILAILFLAVPLLAQQKQATTIRWTDSTSVGYLPLQYLKFKDTVKAYVARSILGDTPGIAQVIRGLGDNKAQDASIASGIVAISKAGDSIKSGIYAVADGAVKVYGLNASTVAEFRKEASRFYSNGSMTFEAMYDSMSFYARGARQFYMDSIGMFNFGTGTNPPKYWMQANRGILFGGNTTLLSTTQRGANGVAAFSENAYTGRPLPWLADAWRYISTDKATNYYQYQGEHVWRVAASGLADSTITWSTAVTIKNTGRVGINTTSPAARLDILAGDSATSVPAFRVRNSTNKRPALSGGGYFWSDGIYLMWQRTSDVWDTLNIASVSAGGSGGTAGGWSRKSVAGAYTATSGDYVHVRLNAGDTTGTSLFNNYGTSDLIGKVTFENDWNYKATTIFQASDTSLVNVSYKGQHISDAYLAKITSADKVSGDAIINGTIGGTTIINTSGTITTSSTVSASSFLGSIDGSYITNLSITAGKIANATITGNQIALLTITAGNLATATITSGQIANSTITGGNIAANTITGGNIATATITAGLIGNLEITAAQIANLTINGTKISTDAIDSTKVKDLSLSGGDLVARTIVASKIATGTLTATEIAAASITGDRLVANTITASQIAAATITGTQIAASTITSDKISVTNLAAINADLGAVTAGSITVGSTNKIWLNNGSDGILAVGGSTKASAPFYVSAAGALTATSATITGTITSQNSGQRVAITSTDASFYDASNHLSGQIYGLGDYNMSVGTPGDLYLISSASGGAVHIGQFGGSYYLNVTKTTHTFLGNTVWDSGAGYVTSALGASTGFTKHQYIWSEDFTEKTEVFKRTLTINGVTVHVLTTD